MSTFSIILFLHLHFCSVRTTMRTHLKVFKKEAGKFPMGGKGTQMSPKNVLWICWSKFRSWRLTLTFLGKRNYLLLSVDFFRQTQNTERKSTVKFPFLLSATPDLKLLRQKQRTKSADLIVKCCFVNEFTVEPWFKGEVSTSDQSFTISELKLFEPKQQIWSCNEYVLI